MAALGTLILDVDALSSAEYVTTKNGKKRLRITVAFNSDEDQYGKNINSWYQKDKDSERIWTGKGKITWVDDKPLNRSSQIGNQTQEVTKKDEMLDDVPF